MKILLNGEDAIRLIVEPGPLTVEAESPEEQYSPFHMLASALATCTFSVLYSWATHANLPGAEEITMDVKWTFADDPHRVGSMELTFDWPGLPPKRLEAARRVAEMCTVHATLMHPPTISIAANAAPAAATATAAAGGAVATGA